MLPGVLGPHLALGVVLDDGLPPEGHQAVGGLVHPGDTVEGGSLARPVGADEGDDLPLVHVQGQVVHRHHAAELHGDMLYVQHVVRHHRTPFALLSRRFWNSSRSPMMPLR